MSVFPGGEGPLERREPHQHGELALYGHVEGLCGEEAELLGIEEHERTAEQHARLRAIREDLDRVWEHLSERAHRHGRPSPPGGGGDTA
jgi:Protein of unknown function (DUF2630)